MSHDLTFQGLELGAFAKHVQSILLSYCPLLVSPLLLKFMLPVHCHWCRVSVRGGEGVKYSHIKVGLLKPTTSDSIGWHIQPCTILTVGWGVTACKSSSTHTSLHTSVSREGWCLYITVQSCSALFPHARPTIFFIPIVFWYVLKITALSGSSFWHSSFHSSSLKSLIDIMCCKCFYISYYIECAALLQANSSWTWNSSGAEAAPKKWRGLINIHKSWLYYAACRFRIFERVD